MFEQESAKVWKACKPLKGFGSSNLPHSAKTRELSIS